MTTRPPSLKHEIAEHLDIGDPVADSRVHYLQVKDLESRLASPNFSCWIWQHLGDLYAESGQTLQGSFSAGWLAGKPDSVRCARGADTG